MSEWKECKISDMGKIVTGKTPRTAISDNYGGDIPFLSPSDDMESKFVHKTARCLTEKGLLEVKNCLIPANSICVSCIGSDMGKSVITDRPIVTNQQINSIVPADSFNPNFVYYLMQNKRREIRFIGGNGTAVPILNKSAFSNLTVVVPTLETQQKIASILSSFDDKIAINRKICANLEAQAQALFKHWFIDFAPFKDGKFVESELGMIPEGWKVGTLGEIAEFKRGKTIIKSETKEGKIPVVAGGLEPAYYHNKSNTSSRVITISGSGANAGFTRMYYEPVWASDCSYADIETTPYLHTAYCYLLVNRKSVNALQWGAAQPHVYPKDINKLPHVLAPYDILLEFEELIKVLFNRIDVCVNESSHLSSLRDTLLPKLMSGEIKV